MRTSRRSRCCAAALLSLAACTSGTENGGAISDQTVGAIAVTTVTTGKSPDSDGYTVAVDGGIPVPIAISETKFVPTLPLGRHEVALDGVAANCSVSGPSTQTASVIGADTVTVVFGVSCSALFGELSISAGIEGDGVDPDGFFFSVDGAPPRPLPFVGVRLDVPVGKRLVELSGLSDNCSGETTGSALVMSDRTAFIRFTITCTATTLSGGAP